LLEIVNQDFSEGDVEGSEVIDGHGGCGKNGGRPEPLIDRETAIFGLCGGFQGGGLSPDRAAGNKRWDIRFFQ